MKDIHRYDLTLHRELVALDVENISEKNKQFIRRFYDDCAVAGLSKSRLIKLVSLTRRFARMLKKDFDVASVDDLKGLVRGFEELNWKSWTKVTNKVVLKKFYKWLKGNNEEYPVEVKWLKTQMRVQDLPLLSQKELFSDEEIDRAVSAAINPRDKAFVSVLAESGGRISEIGCRMIRDVAFDNKGVIIVVTGKTGPRQVRLIHSAPHLATWLNCHPRKDDPDAPLWVNLGSMRHKQMMMYTALAKVLKSAFLRAGIKKKCRPHLFRHSRATVMSNHLTEFQMNHYFGWKQGSKMPSTYVHLSGVELDSALLKMNGLEENSQKEIQKPLICHQCQSINAKDSRYCCKCAAVLGESQIVKEHPRIEIKADLFKELLNDPAVQKVIMEKVLSRG